MTAHWAFVAAAYGIAATIVVVVIAATMRDYRALKRGLAALEKRGAARRSGAPAGSPTGPR